MNFLICHIPFHYYLFKSIYENLENTYFVIPPFYDSVMTTEWGGGMSAKGKYEYISNFLKRKNIECIDYGKRNSTNLSNFLNKYAENVIISQWFDGVFLLDNARLIGLMYSLAGVANSDRMSQSIRENFLPDVLLTYGPNSAQRLTEKGLKAQPVGNPLFDDFFRNSLSNEDVKAIKTRIDDNKQTILYAPTHTLFSSIDNYYNLIRSLSSEYNVIVKVHHVTFYEEPNRMCKLLSAPDLIVLGDYFNPIPLYKIADIVLADNSGTFFDAILVEKPVILLEVLHRNEGFKFMYKHDSLSQEKSVTANIAKNPDELPDLIRRYIGRKMKMDQDLTYALFYHRDGNAGKRIAEIIRNSKEFPAIPVLKKYERALKIVDKDEEREFILSKRDMFLNHYQKDSPSNFGKVKKKVKCYLKRRIRCQ